MQYRLFLAVTLALLAGCSVGPRPVITDSRIVKCPPEKPKLEYLEEKKCPPVIPEKGPTLRSFSLAWEDLVVYAQCKVAILDLWEKNWDDCP